MFTFVKKLYKIKCKETKKYEGKIWKGAYGR